MYKKVSQGQLKGVGYVNMNSFIFEMKYQTAKSNKAPDSLYHHPHKFDFSDSSHVYREHEAVSNTTVCKDVAKIVNLGEVTSIVKAVNIQRKYQQ